MVPSRSENGARNESFLVLDVGNNTVRLGSSSASPIPSQAFHMTVGDADTVSSSTEEGSSSSSSGNRKRVSKKREDPDWVPEKKVRKSSSWSFRTAKLKPGPTEISPGTSISNGRLEVSPAGGGYGMNDSESAPPPEYLVRLLKLYYNWRVDFDQSLGEYVYICPAGLAHRSLSDAFESFLHGTSKYSEKVPSRNSTQGVPALVANFRPQIVAAGNDNGKKERRGSTAVEEMAPVRPVGESHLLQHNTLHENGKQSSQKLGTVLSQPENPADEKTKSYFKGGCFDNEFNRLDCRGNLTTENDPGCNRETRPDGTLFSVRRPVRIIGRHVPIGSETDTTGASESVVSPAVRKGECAPMLNDQMHCSMNGGCLIGKAKMLDSSSLVHLNQTEISVVNPCSGAIGVRRSMRINGKRVPVDDEFDTRMSVDDDYLDWPEFAASMVANDDEGKKITSFFRVDNMEGRMASSGDAQLKQANREKSDFHKLNRENPESGDSQTNGKKSDCQEFNTQKHRESRNFLKHEKAKKPRAEKCSVAEANFLPCVAKRKQVSSGDLHGKKKKRRNGGCCLTIRRNKKNGDHEQASTQTKLCILSWLIDSGTLTENEKVVCITKNNTSNVFSGLVTREGVWCDCCEEVMTLLKFQAHAGSDLRQPWENIFLLSGKTLMQCLREAWEKEKKYRKVDFRTVGVDPDPSDDTCGVCADGGHLICCDNCPSTFHQNCLMLKVLPEGSWYCPYCRCTFCTVAGHGSDKGVETLTLHTCKQCGCKYHQDCAWEIGKQEMGKVSFSFCRENCKKIADRLSDILGTSYPMDGGVSWTLLKNQDEYEGVGSYERHSFITECNVKLSMALAVLNECFVPLIDQRTGVDMICQAVYSCGSNFQRLNYEGFYTLILEKDEEIISAASLRFHGTKLAEMPFIGTRPVFRRQGMCRRLLNTIEHMLSSLDIEKLVIPAISDMLDTWMTSFSFKCLEPSDTDEIRNLSMVIFPETTLLQKPICKTGAMGQKGKMVSHDNNGDHRKHYPKAYELPSSFGERIYGGDHVAGGQGWCGHLHIFNGQDSTLEPCSRDSSFSTSPSIVPQPKTLNGSTSKIFPTHSTFLSRLDTVPQSRTATAVSFPSVNVVEDSDPAGTRIVSASSDHMNGWLPSADEAKDFRSDAINSSLAFDRLFRISS